MEHSFEVKDKTIIQFRQVVNDAIVGPWEPMPEVQPPTIMGLVDYLRNTCRINPHPLNIQHTFSDGTYVSYGPRKQFFIPGEPTEEELKLLEEFSSKDNPPDCPICSRTLTFSEEQKPTFSEWSAYCRNCGITFSLNTAAQAAIDLTRAIKAAVETAKLHSCTR